MSFLANSSSKRAIKPLAIATRISSPCSGPKWNNSRAGGKRMTPARIAVVAAPTHHRAALGSCERSKNGRAKRPIDEDKAEIGGDQGGEGKGACVRLRQFLMQRHDEEAGHQGQDKSSLKKAPNRKADSE